MAEDVEEIVGCSSDHHGLIYCDKCVFAFGEGNCWSYRKRYNPKLIEKGHFEKFTEPDPRRKSLLVTVECPDCGGEGFRFRNLPDNELCPRCKGKCVIDKVSH